MACGKKISLAYLPEAPKYWHGIEAMQVDRE
jgi:hypothetical protein